MMSEFKTGEVVRLKSGSPKMTIKGPDGDAWAVQWIDRNGKLQGDSFHADMLDIFVPQAREARGPRESRGGPRHDPYRDPKFR